MFQLFLPFLPSVWEPCLTHQQTAWILSSRIDALYACLGLGKVAESCRKPGSVRIWSRACVAILSGITMGTHICVTDKTLLSYVACTWSATEPASLGKQNAVPSVERSTESAHHDSASSQVFVQDMSGVILDPTTSQLCAALVT